MLKKYILQTFEYTVSAICYSFAKQRTEKDDLVFAPPYNDLVRFVLFQHSQMTDIFRMPLIVATLFFNMYGVVYGGKFFHRLPHSARLKQIASWKRSKLSFCRDLIRFYESLTVVSLYSRLDNELMKE